MVRAYFPRVALGTCEKLGRIFIKRDEGHTFQENLLS